jgi:hypothetical protein
VGGGGSSGLAFTCQALQNMQADRSSELHICFRRSYDSVLSHHHTFVIRSVVSVRQSVYFSSRFSLVFAQTAVLLTPKCLKVAIRAVPCRQEFYRRIAQGGSIAKLDVELARWLQGLDAVVKHTRKFLEEGGYGRV